MQRIRKGDEVIVITGKDKGKKGIVSARIDDRRITVEGVNVARKAVRPNPMTGAEGGIQEKTLPIDQSNVMLFNPSRHQEPQLFSFFPYIQPPSLQGLCSAEVAS